MSPDGTIHWRRQGAHAVAVIDRPERRNALNADLCERLRGHLSANRDLRAVVIGGEGRKAFCAGADLAVRSQDAGGLGHGGGDTFRPAFEALLDEIVDFPAPVIAAVNGAAIGAGMQLAVACDVRVVDPGATFGIPAGRLGVVISAVNVERLVRVVGDVTARDVLLTARTLTYEDALAAGLVQRTGEPALDVAEALARELAELAPLSMTAHKQALNRIARSGALSTVDREELRAGEVRAFESADLREGLAAFSEKRSPKFSGR